MVLGMKWWISVKWYTLFNGSNYRLLLRASCSSQKTCPCFRVQMEGSFTSHLSRTSLVTKCFFGGSKKQFISPDMQLSNCATQLGALVTSKSPEASDIPILGDEKIGVLLLNLGGPETLDDVQPFLFNLFADPVILIVWTANSASENALISFMMPSVAFVGMLKCFMLVLLGYYSTTKTVPISSEALGTIHLCGESTQE